MRKTAYFASLLVLVPGLLFAKATKLDDYHWTGVERVVAIGDLHGDYDQFLKVMRSAGLLDKKGRWAGGKTHLVQTGDVPDRGPDSRKIIDHLIKLAKQAREKGGYIHMLIGNHEAMNVIGDLRYTTAGEFQSYTTHNSKRLQDLQWQRQLDWMRSHDSKAFEALDLDAFHSKWQQRVPLGWVEHRQAWALNGEYGHWVEGNRVAIQVNDTLFLHGGISAKYCKFSLQALTEQLLADLQSYDPAVTSISDDPLGPVWYRGLAQEKEQGVFIQTLDNILKRYGVRRIVIGHTPTGGVVWPRFDQRVIVNDTGIAAYYGSHKGVLELTPNSIVAIYGDHRLPVPENNAGRVEYLRAVIEADSNNALLKKRLAQLLVPVMPMGASEAVVNKTADKLLTDQGGPGSATADDGDLEIATVVPQAIPGTCQ